MQLASGLFCNSKATMPATSGEAKEVPLFVTCAPPTPTAVPCPALIRAGICERVNHPKI